MKYCRLNNSVSATLPIFLKASLTYLQAIHSQTTTPLLNACSMTNNGQKKKGSDVTLQFASKEITMSRVCLIYCIPSLAAKHVLGMPVVSCLSIEVRLLVFEPTYSSMEGFN